MNQILIIILIILFTIPTLFLIALHLGFRAPRNREKGSPADYDIEFSELSIPTVSGKKLFAWLLPVKTSNETLIILHGWGSNSEWMLPVAQPFHHAGINILLIDSRCHGNSDSALFSSLPRFTEDLESSIDWLQLNHPQITHKIATIGHSVGAGAVLFAASKREDIQATISISAFAHPEWMMRRYLQSLHLPVLIIHVILYYVEWLIGHSFAKIAPINTICQIKTPVLLVHGKADITVPIEDAQAILSSCKNSQIHLIKIEDAGHESVDKVEQHCGKLIHFLKQSGFMQKI